MKSETILSWVLTIVGCGLMVAFAFVLLPGSQMATIYGMLGLGEMPRQPIVFYLARSTSLLYGVHGAVMFVCGRNLKKYADLVPLLGWLHVLMGVAMIGIDLRAGMPWWWSAFEGTPIALTGAAILWLGKRAAQAHCPGT